VPVRVQQEPFETEKEVKALLANAENAGAVVTFTGIVRGRDERGEIKAFHLEHYPAMTAKKITEIANEAKKRWNIEDCLVIHRHGTLKPGEEIVLVVCISSHRGEAFKAANFLMDWLKTKAPFWKKEEYADGSHWVEAKAEDDAEAQKWDE